MVDLQELLTLKADLQSRMRLIPFDGSVEVKPRGAEKFIYVRKRVAGKNTSVFIDKYSDELFALMTRQAIELRALKKELRKVEKELAALGYVEGELSAAVLLNIDFARANMKNLIYDQAVLEGVLPPIPPAFSDALARAFLSRRKGGSLFRGMIRSFFLFIINQSEFLRFDDDRRARGDVQTPHQAGDVLFDRRNGFIHFKRNLFIP